MAKDTLNYQTVMATAKQTLAKDLGYSSIQEVVVEGENCLVAFQQDRPLVLVYIPETLETINSAMEELAIQLGAVIEGGPTDYVWATVTGLKNEGYMYSWLPENECEVSSLPPYSEALSDEQQTVQRLKVKADPQRFKKLQQEFDDLHEKIYAAREPVDGANDITAQLCKLIFLKMHLERNPDFQAMAGSPKFVDVFQPEYIRQHQQEAVKQIKTAFEEAKKRPEYRIQDDQGHDFTIFDPDDFIKFNQPETYALVARMLNAHRLTSPEATGVEDDILGRAFDVMLRRRFESKGGMGIYLTPQQVRDAMVQIAFYDILQEEAEAITRKDPQTGKPLFRVGDPCCGSAGFLVTAMHEVRKHVNKLLGLSDQQRVELLSDIYSNGFIGADSAPNMVLMARINMALHGDPKVKVYRTENSLTSEVLTPGSFDLLITNPPFKKGGIKEGENSEILAMYRSDVQGDLFQMSNHGLALGAKPNSKGKWMPVKSVDPAVLFIDRCLQLLKPGGRLLIVLPDGILCNSGDQYVREYIMGKKDEQTGKFVGGKAIVKAVISLPPVTFRLSGAGAKTSFLYLQKKRPGDEQGPVFMAVANDIGFDVKQNKEVQTGGKDLVEIVEAYKKGIPEELVA